MTYASLSWFLTSPEAWDNKPVEAAEKIVEADKQDEVTGPPTRKELEQKAAELERHTVGSLLKRIDQNIRRADTSEKEAK